MPDKQEPGKTKRVTRHAEDVRLIVDYFLARMPENPPEDSIIYWVRKNTARVVSVLHDTEVMLEDDCGRNLPWLATRYKLPFSVTISQLREIFGFKPYYVSAARVAYRWVDETAAGVLWMEIGKKAA